MVQLSIVNKKKGIAYGCVLNISFRIARCITEENHRNKRSQGDGELFDW